MRLCPALHTGVDRVDMAGRNSSKERSYLSETSWSRVTEQEKISIRQKKLWVCAGIKPHERALLGAALTRDDESEREHWARWLLGEA